MRQILSALVVLGLLSGLLEATPDVPAQVAGIPEGARIELRLKSKEKLRGTRGAITDSGFTLVDAHRMERRIAFDEVETIKLYRSHTTRNVLIIVGIGVVATVGIIAAVVLRCGPLGCNSKL